MAELVQLNATQQWQTELLQLLARQGRRMPVPVFLIAVVLALFVADELPAYIWGSWLGLVLAVLLARMYWLGRLPDLTALSLEQRVLVAVVLSGINGVTHGLSIGFFPLIPEFERAIQSMLIVAMCTGAVATTAGYPPIFLAYVIPALFPLILMWAWSAFDGGGWTELSVSILTIMMAMLLISLARDANRLFRESIEIRQQQVALNKELTAALARAEAAAQAKTQFLASASHDLRQPIHTLSLFSAALAMQPLDSRSAEIAEQMNVALHSLATEFDAILDISKLDAGVVQSDVRSVDLAALVSRLEHEFATEASASGLEFKVACPNHCHVLTDEMLFERILRNLLANAIKYTREGHVHLSVEARGAEVAVSVADTGHGIPDTEKDRIFDEFYQLGNPERDRSKGLGLGLSIVKRIVDLLGIELTMTSSPGNGTRFELRLEPASQAAALSELSDKVVALPSLSVLVVDDEVQVGLGMRALLTGMGCDVSICDGTEDAIAHARTHKPDIVLADFRLRGTDNGLWTIRALRALYPELPALLISGDIAPDRLLAAESAGVTMLHKPVAVSALSQAIVAAVSGH